MLNLLHIAIRVLFGLEFCYLLPQKNYCKLKNDPKFTIISLAVPQQVKKQFFITNL